MAAQNSKGTRRDKDARRSNCPIACSLDIFGDKWTLLVVRDIKLGKRRYSDFLESPENYPTNLLSSRLKRLEECGIIEKVLYQKKPPRGDFYLTAKGYALEGVLESLSDWGLQFCENVQPLTLDAPHVMDGEEDDAEVNGESQVTEEPVHQIAVADEQGSVESHPVPQADTPAAPVVEEQPAFVHEDADVVVNGSGAMHMNGEDPEPPESDPIPEPEVLYDPPPNLTETPAESIPEPEDAQPAAESPEPAPTAERTADEEDGGQLSLFG